MKNKTIAKHFDWILLKAMDWHGSFMPDDPEEKEFCRKIRLAERALKQLRKKKETK